MSDATFSRPQVNGILETSLYVERPTQSVGFYRRIFGFEPIDAEKDGITDETRLCAVRAGDSQRAATVQKRRYSGHKRHGRDPRRLQHFPVGTRGMEGVAVAAGDYD